jgi:hypothetical protein
MLDVVLDTNVLVAAFRSSLGAAMVSVYPDARKASAVPSTFAAAR